MTTSTPISPPKIAGEKRKNAFSKLMTPKKKPTTSPAASQIKSSSSAKPSPLSGLGVYIDRPETFPSTTVLSFDDDFVLIHDMYPKSTVHLLLLPRDQSKTHLHPFDAFDDAVFLQSVRVEAAKAAKFVEGELRRRYGHLSETERAYEEGQSEQALGEVDVSNEGQDSEDRGYDPVPKTSQDNQPRVKAGHDANSPRNYAADIEIGIHSAPSMSHLHVHIFSPDRVSDSLKSKKHYNSFSTPFFVPLSDFPLSEDDERRSPERQKAFLAREYVCWKCGQGFGRDLNGATGLKAHLKEEMNAWLEK